MVGMIVMALLLISSPFLSIYLSFPDQYGLRSGRSDYDRGEEAPQYNNNYQGNNYGRNRPGNDRPNPRGGFNGDRPPNQNGLNNDRPSNQNGFNNDRPSRANNRSTSDSEAGIGCITSLVASSPPYSRNCAYFNHSIMSATLLFAVSMLMMMMMKDDVVLGDVDGDNNGGGDNDGGDDDDDDDDDDYVFMMIIMVMMMCISRSSKLDNWSVT
jgi:hypothetical protein